MNEVCRIYTLRAWVDESGVHDYREKTYVSGKFEIVSEEYRVKAMVGDYSVAVIYGPDDECVVVGDVTDSQIDELVDYLDERESE